MRPNGLFSTVAAVRSSFVTTLSGINLAMITIAIETVTAETANAALNRSEERRVGKEC